MVIQIIFKKELLKMKLTKVVLSYLLAAASGALLLTGVAVLAER